MSMAAAQCPVVSCSAKYQDSVTKEMAFVLDNADVHYAIVEDQEQVDKLLEMDNEDE